MADYKIEIERLKKAGIEPKVGTKISMKLKDGTASVVEITKVEKDVVIVTAK